MNVIVRDTVYPLKDEDLAFLERVIKRLFERAGENYNVLHRKEVKKNILGHIMAAFQVTWIELRYPEISIHARMYLATRDYRTRVSFYCEDPEDRSHDISCPNKRLISQ